LFPGNLIQFISRLNTTFTSPLAATVLVFVAGITAVVAMAAVATVVEFLVRLSVANFQSEPILIVKINTKGAVLAEGFVEIVPVVTGW
jgi:CHASE2 domain-containing sensor protein